LKIKGINYNTTRDVFIDGKRLDPSKSLKIYNHSPDGFSWGYGGSGPSQLALAILLETLTKEEAISNYQSFKWEYVSKFPQSDFEADIDIKQWINKSQSPE